MNGDTSISCNLSNCDCDKPKAPHALTREQVEKVLCRFGIDIRAEWRGDWKALGDTDAALRHALTKQAQEVDIVSADLSEARHQIGLLQQRIDTHCMTEAELRQQVATMETNAADNGTLFRAVLNEKLTLAQEVVKYAEEAQGYLVKIEHLADQLAAMTAERDAWQKAAQQYNGTYESLQQQLAASQARVRELDGAKDGAYLERNHLVAALARCFPSGIRKTAIEGWSGDWHGCVYIDLPAGQISYHYHDSQAFLFEALPAYTKLYDGHTKDDVHERLKSAQLQATLAERERRVALLEEYQKRCEGIEDNLAKSIAENEQLAVDLDTARRDAARLREALYAIACKNEPFEREDMIDFAQRALKGEGCAPFVLP